MEKGKTFPVVSQAGGWYAVEFGEPFDGMKTGWLPATAAVPVAQTNPSASSTAEAVFVKLTEQAARFKQAYQNNPYVTVSGFTVNVVPPSVSVNFEFRK